jgi:hypothetical protein
MASVVRPRADFDSGYLPGQGEEPLEGGNKRLLNDRFCDGEQVALAIGPEPWSEDRVVRFRHRLMVMFVTRGVHPKTVARIFRYKHHSATYRVISQVPEDVEAADNALIDLA